MGFIKFLRPMAFIRRKAIYSGLLGGNRKWLIVGGAAWLVRGAKNVLGEGEPAPVHTQDLDAGERFVILHNSSDKGAKRRNRRKS